MRIPNEYSGIVLVNEKGQRGTNNLHAQYPYKEAWAKKNIFYVYYCGNPDCLRRVHTTWNYCPRCGQKITWTMPRKRKR